MSTTERADQLMFSFALSVAITLIVTVALDAVLPWLVKDLQLDRVEFALVAAIVSVLFSLVVPWVTRSFGATPARTLHDALHDALREPHPDDLQSTWHAQALGILIGLWIGLGLLATLGWGV